MHKVLVGITSVILLSGIFVWNADATPLSGSAILHSAPNSSLVEKAACSPNSCCSTKPYLCYFPCFFHLRWCKYCSPDSSNTWGPCDRVHSLKRH